MTVLLLRIVGAVFGAFSLSGFYLAFASKLEPASVGNVFTVFCVALLCLALAKVIDPLEKLLAAQNAGQ